MRYEYSGILKTILKAPDASVREALDCVEFHADDLAHWNVRDLESDREWLNIPAHRGRVDGGVRLVGRFDEVRLIDLLPPDDPRFWVPLGSLGWNDSRFPIDLGRYPIAEVTYRCTTEHAKPVWLWTYPGGLHVDALPVAQEWMRVARRIPHFGYPKQLDALIFRLFSTTRTTESIEIQSVRFRAMSQAEREACQRDEARLSPLREPKRYPVLSEFLPLGVWTDAEVARRCADLLELTFSEYWALAFEDLVTHHHNCIAIEHTERLSESEWQELITLAEAYGIRLAVMHNFDLESDDAALRREIDQRIRPYAGSDQVFSWSPRTEPSEIDFPRLMQVKQWIEEIDANHPVTVITEHPSSFPLYGPFFSAAGIDHYTSHAPWEMGEIVRSHLKLGTGQQFWVLGPTFMYATGTPEWSTSPELRLMVNLAFANGARGWFSYAYHNEPMWVSGSMQRTLTGPFLMFSDLWIELDRRMERLLALAPLLLSTQPAPLPRDWFTESKSADTLALLPEGVPPTSSFRLKGPDFNLYVVVSNDVRGMSSLNVNIPRETLRGMEIYDLTDFIGNRTWAPMALQRHIEMFPGQAQSVIVAPREVCERCRDVIARRLIEDDRRQLAFNLNLAHTYQLDTGPVEELLASVGDEPLHGLEVMDRARDLLVDMMYGLPAIRDTRSRIIEATAAVCACDGVLCRLMTRGRVDLARDWGAKVVPIAREITHLRLDLRRGKARTAIEQSADVARRAIALLRDIRALE